MDGVVVCDEVVGMLWNDIEGFDPLELVYAQEVVVYDSGNSALLSLECVGGWRRVGVGTSVRFKPHIEDYIPTGSNDTSCLKNSSCSNEMTASR